MTARQNRRPVPWDEINERRRDRAAKAPGAPRDVSACRSDNCRAAIRWAVTTDGKRMPVDFAPDPAGNLVRVMVAAGDWRIRVLAAGEDPGPDVLRWTSHYATCPDADTFRPRRARTPDPAAEQAARAALAPLTAAPPAARVLLAVDGNSLAHRAFYGYQRLGTTAPDGRPVWAVHGFLVLLAGIIDKTRPDALVVGFDDRNTSVRRDAYPDYKAGRAEKSLDLYAQLAEIAVVLLALGVPVVAPDGLEADDVLGSAAAAAEAAGWRAVLATSDKDAFGLITDRTDVLRLVSGLDNAVRMTPDKLAEEYGVRPDQWLDYVALVGDDSDHLRGVEGIGPKTAVKLLAALGTVDRALADPAATTAAIGKAAAGKLATPAAAAVLARNRELMAIRRDLPIDPDACGPDTTPAAVTAVLPPLGLAHLVDRVTAALCPATGPAAPRQRRHLAAVPDAPPAPTGPAGHPPAPPLERADPAPVCPDCGAAAAAELPLAQLDAGVPALTGGTVLVDAEHPAGDLLAVQVDGVWAVRRCAGESYLPPANRRRAHHCIPYPHACLVCGGPARLYPAGPLCDQHPPAGAAGSRRG